MIPKYRLVERSDSNERRIICKGDLQYCLDTLFNCEASNIDSNDHRSRMYIIEKSMVKSTERS